MKLAIPVLLATAAGLTAQNSTMRASFTGGGGDRGKCTIEVLVDDVAEIEVSGDTARLHTLAGRPAQFRRFVCNGPMPRNPGEFRFRGVDGRGRQTLVRDPGDGRGLAVIRIEDPDGGAEGYTFDLEWRGVGGDYSRGGDRRDDRRDDRYDDRGRGYGRGNVSIVSCSSDDGRRSYCDADTRGGVRLVRQRSGSACRLDETWGYNRRGIWVDRGCRADFEVAR